MTALESAPTAGGAPRPARSLILVAGSGRSGTSLVSGLLQRLGARVPQPEVPADASNPKGFAESQWVVDFHTKLLRRARMQMSDARPAAWSRTAPIAADPEVQAQARAFLARQFGEADDVLVKDPRITWFLPLWRQAAEDLRATPRVIMMLRHPAAVAASKETYYEGDRGETSRTAEWVNQTLFTEHATRDVPRALLGYGDLLDDWAAALGAAADQLDLALVRDAPALATDAAHAFLDRDLDRAQRHWGTTPPPLQELAEAVWDELTRPAQDPRRLDELRAAYAELYTQAEGIAFSSILAGPSDPLAPRRPLSPRTRNLLARVPKPLQRALPAALRHRALRLLRR